MDIKFIKELADIIESTGINEVEFTSGIDTIRLTKNDNNICTESKSEVDNNNFDIKDNNLKSNEIINKGNKDSEKYLETENVIIQDSNENLDYISSNMIGTFYSKPSPDELSFVKVGDIVKSEQTLCIIESMKLMNEIKATFDCEIVEILVNEEEVLEYGQNIFAVRRV